MAESFSFGSPAVANGDDGVLYVLGTEFEPSVNGSWTGIEWFAPSVIDGNNHYILAYLKTSGTTGTVLASKLITPSAGSLQQFSFTTPLSITASTRYVACVLTGHYTATTSFGWPATTTHLTAPNGVNGRLVVTSADTAAFPSTVSGNSSTFHISPIATFTGAVSGTASAALGGLTAAATGVHSVAGVAAAVLNTLQAMVLPFGASGAGPRIVSASRSERSTSGTRSERITSSTPGGRL